MLCEHRVLTTTQITQLAFGTTRAATARLLTLYPTRPSTGSAPSPSPGPRPGTSSWAPPGAQVLAAEDAITLAQLGYRRDRALAIALSPRLAHDTGVNAFFTALAARARTTPGAGLSCWWSERRCAALWGDLARPDAYGRWHEHAPGGAPRKPSSSSNTTPAPKTCPACSPSSPATGCSPPAPPSPPPCCSGSPHPAARPPCTPAWPPSAPGMTGQVPVATATPATAAPAGPPGRPGCPPATPGPRRRLAALAAAWPAASPPARHPPQLPPASRAALGHRPRHRAALARPRPTPRRPHPATAPPSPAPDRPGNTRACPLGVPA